jgi:septal ring-binding cell division protein DamX
MGVSAAALLVLVCALGWNQWGSRVGILASGRESSMASSLIVKEAGDTESRKGAQVVAAVAQGETLPVKDARERLPESSELIEEQKKEQEPSTLVTEMATDKASLPVVESPAVLAVAPVPTAMPASALEEQTGPEREQEIDKSPENLMAQRRKAGNQWLRQVGKNGYTLQLMAVDVKGEAEVEVEKFLRKIRPASLLEKIYVLPATRGERQVWVVVYGEFSEVTPARQVIDTLPSEARRFQPFVRRIDEALQGKNTGVQQGAQEFEGQLPKQL